MSLAVERLSHVYQPGTPWEVAALSDVDLKIEAGESVAIIGATGSGKSTLVQHFNGLLKPTSGTVKVDGHDIWARGADRRQVRRRVGLIFQYPEQQLFEETVAADIAFGPKNLDVGEKEIKDRVRRAMELVGLAPELAERSPFELSGGQMRRVAIAGVLAMEPGILILDEPTAGLDPRGRQDILQRIADLHRRRGKTIVMVSHNMEEIAHTVERIVVMSQGTVVMDGPTREIFSQGERLRTLGLDVPEMTRLMEQLSARGWPVPPTALSVDEAEQIILEHRPGGDRDGRGGPGGDRARHRQRDLPGCRPSGTDAPRGGSGDTPLSGGARSV